MTPAHTRFCRVAEDYLRPDARGITILACLLHPEEMYGHFAAADSVQWRSDGELAQYVYRAALVCAGAGVRA